MKFSDKLDQAIASATRPKDFVSSLDRAIDTTLRTAAKKWIMELDGSDAKLRSGEPRVGMIHLYAPFTDTIVDTKYCLIGTDYGYVHTSAGDVRTWDTISGAKKWLAQNYPSTF
jgi:hypothetical protein